MRGNDAFSPVRDFQMKGVQMKREGIREVEVLGQDCLGVFSR